MKEAELQHAGVKGAQLQREAAKVSKEIDKLRELHKKVSQDHARGEKSCGEITLHDLGAGKAEAHFQVRLPKSAALHLLSAEIAFKAAVLAKIKAQLA